MWMFIMYSLCILLLAFIIQRLSTGKNNSIKLYSKYFLYIFIVSILSIFSMPISFFRLNNIDNIKLACSYIRYTTKLVGIKWELRNKHFISEERAGVIVSNHQSCFDALGIMNVFYVMKHCVIITKKIVFYIWPFGLAAYAGGMVFIDRSSPAKSYKQFEDLSQFIVKNKSNVWIFPEGTRNSKRSFLPFKRGAFKMAIMAQVPIIPVVYSPYYFINKSKNFFGNGKIIMTCLDPIDTKGLIESDIDMLLMKTRNLMMECYETVRKEILSDLPSDYPLTAEIDPKHK